MILEHKDREVLIKKLLAYLDHTDHEISLEAAGLLIELDLGK